MSANEPPEITGDSYDERREQLIAATRERKRRLDTEQKDILDAISEEHGGDEIETTHAITPEHTVTLRCKLDGKLVDQLGAIEDRLDRWEEYDPETDPRSAAPPISDLSRTADEIAGILDRIVADDEWDKDLFYAIYEDENIDVLGDIFSGVIEAVQTASERHAGAVDGFREE